MIFKKRFSILFIFFVFVLPSLAQIEENEPSLDVLYYQLHLEPDILQKHLAGNVTIHFTIHPDANEVVFDCGKLLVKAIKGESSGDFYQKNGKLFVQLSGEKLPEYKWQISYEGTPTRGVVFLPEKKQIYTVFFTQDWMVCNANVEDRASIQMNLIIPDGFNCIANGRQIKQEAVGENKMRHSWAQKIETPAYTYGFAVGIFNHICQYLEVISLNHYSSKHSQKELSQIFQYTADMLQFFEEKSGVSYPETSYSQILIGNHYQEMAGFAVLKESYGEMVLKDSTETNLISHELAHQWWGNRITCKDWTHFWLNEGFATFMSAAYNEHRFGREKYLKDIHSYRAVYEKIRDKGGDKPLVFPDWDSPSRDDRNLIYFKGAYVLHLLREELGDQAFWNGIKHFSKKNRVSSVITKDLQKAMEKSSGRNLQDFFDEWIY